MAPEKKKNKLNYVPYLWAKDQCPDACIIDSYNPNSKESNRPIKDDEKRIHFLSSAMLNVHGERLFSDLVWQFANKRTYVEINRVPETSPYFGIRKYRIRFAGYHGEKSCPIYLVSKEDESDMYAVRGELEDKCPQCGSLDSRFRITPTSKCIRCGGCMGFEGIHNGL
jgi:hypothetical protein